MRSQQIILLLACVGFAVLLRVQAHESQSVEENDRSTFNSTEEQDGEGQKEGLGKGYGYKHGHKKHYNDFIPPFPHNRPFHDTHYCSVHGSFALSYSKSVSYPTTYGPPKERHNRQYLREFCRFSASHSAQSCKFCCKVVARSAFTNPDDIISAIFAFDPTNPTAGGVGLPKRRDDHDDNDYDNDYKQDGYGENNYQPPQYGQGPPQYQPQPPQYGNPPPPPQYRQRRDASPPAPPPATETTNPLPSNPNLPVPLPPSAYGNTDESFAPVNQCVCCAPKTHYDHDRRRHHHRRHHHHDDY